MFKTMRHLLDIRVTRTASEAKDVVGEVVAISRTTMAAVAGEARTTTVGMATNEGEEVDVAMEEVGGVEAEEVDTTTGLWMMLERSRMARLLRGTMLLLRTRISHRCKSSIRLLSSWSNSNSSSINSISNRCKTRAVREVSREEAASCSIFDAQFRYALGLCWMFRSFSTFVTDV
jgi:hypothetical protein